MVPQAGSGHIRWHWSKQVSDHQDLPVPARIWAAGHSGRTRHVCRGAVWHRLRVHRRCCPVPVGGTACARRLAGTMPAVDAVPSGPATASLGGFVAYARVCRYADPGKAPSPWFFPSTSESSSLMPRHQARRGLTETAGSPMQLLHQECRGEAVHVVGIRAANLMVIYHLVE